MIFSKKNLSLLFIIATLYSCSATVDGDSQPEAIKAKADANSLVVADLGISAVQELGDTPTSRIATLKYYTMKACFETSFKRKLDSHELEISGNDFDTQLITADNDGCINWEEVINVDLTRSNQIVEFKRSIKLSGTGFGAKLHFGIDPINKNNFYDLNKTKKRIQNDDSFNKLSTQDTIVMDQIRFTPKGYGKIDPRNDNNVIDKPFVANTCFNFKSNGVRMAGQVVDVIMVNQEKDEVLKKENFTLNENGCAELSFAMMHERYTNTRRIPFDFIVRAKNPALKDAVVSRRVCLYPWSNSGWVFGHDTISGECPEDSKDQRATIFLDEVDYSFLGHDIQEGFHINKDLDMVIVKSYVINMYPKINYGNFVDAIDPIEPLYQGRFRLKVILLAPTEGDIELTQKNYNKFRIISAMTKEVEIESRRLKARIDLPIKFSDVPFVYTRTYAVVKLEPLEESDTSLLPGIAAGTFNASSKMFRSVLHTQVDVEDTITKEKASMKELRGFLDNLFNQIGGKSGNEIIKLQLDSHKKTALESFNARAKQNTEMEDFVNLKISALNKKLAAPLETNELRGLLEDTYSRETMTKLCSLFFDSTEMGVWLFKSHKDLNYKRCIDSPETMMDIQAFSHINSILSKPKVTFSNTIRLNNSTGTGSYHGTSDRISTSRSVKAGAGVKFDIPVVNIGLSGGVDVQKMWGHDMQTGVSNRSDVGSAIDLYAEKLTLVFSAQTNKCFTVSGTQTYSIELDDQINGGFGSMMGMGVHFTEKVTPNKKRFRICLDNSVKENLTESWFYIGEGHQFNTVLRDGLNMTENKYITLIRGEKNMARFINFLHENVGNIFMKKVKNQILPDSYMKDSFSNFRLAFDKNNDLVSDSAIPGTVEKFDDLGNSGDQYFGTIPEKDFNPLTSGFGTTYK